MRILVVGTPSRGTQAILSRLASCGWGSRTVETLREAEVLVNTFRFDIVLATESLPDGRAYAMTQTIARRSGTLIVAIALSESCLWLPVVDQGRRVLGTRALNPERLEREAEKILRASDAKQLRTLPPEVNPGPRRAGVPRRKSHAA
jgi:DNA-binding response OmpR family regulator